MLNNSNMMLLYIFMHPGFNDSLSALIPVLKKGDDDT